MRASDYPSTTVINPEDMMLLDGPRGTKSIPASKVGGKGINTLDELYQLYDDIGISYKERRNIFRGKNLGSEFTAEQKARIADGSFKGFFIGDYWETEGANSNRYRIADINYWLHTGDTECTTNHLVIVPDKGVGDPQKMNDTNVTTGGYIGSKMYTSYINTAKSIIDATLGATNILNHRELFTNAVTNGYPSGGAWVNSRIELLSEPMVYGSYIETPGSTGSITPYRYTIDKTQLSLFKLHPEFIVLVNDDGTRGMYWLRDVVSALCFAKVNGRGHPYDDGASNSDSIRPVFGIISS